VRILLAFAALTLGAAACEPVTAPASSPYQLIALTPDGSDSLTVYGDQGSTVVHAPPTNTGGNSRAAWTVTGAPATTDQTACATWDASSHGFAQEGILLRWDGQRGITVTKNVYGSVFTVVNVHTWDLAHPEAPFTQVGTGFPVPAITQPDGTVVPLPWRMCARATAGIVDFKVWPTAMAEPSWVDPCCTGAVIVPLTAAGKPGWFAGHVQPGHVLAYRNLTTEALP
jgi:hypothetical protein